MTKRYVSQLLTVLSTIAALAACQPAHNPETPAATDGPKALLNKDLAAFDAVPSLGAQSYDAEHAQLFTKIFGGTSGANLRSYLSERIHIYVSLADKGYKVSDYTVVYPGWEKDEDYDKNMRSAKAQVGASNFGTGYWYESIINKQPIYLKSPDGTITKFDSPRVGAMILGDGYNDDPITLKDGTVLHLPPAYRQAIIIHEARHSDCTGGVNEADLEVARVAKSNKDFSATFPKPACGHLHSHCPPGHEMANLPACDSHPWGAYAVESVFVAATARAANGLDQRILDAVAVDAIGRLTVDSAAMLRGELGPPDMTSTGLK
jgi:hypothetical protein